MIGVWTFQQKYTKKSELELFVDTHNSSQVPPIHGPFVIYYNKAAISVFFIVELH
jgi:hypothetical protein